MLSPTFWLDLMAQIHVGCCLACRHIAVRIRADGTAVCDWCAITKSEAVWRREGDDWVIRGDRMSTRDLLRRLEIRR